MTTTAKEVGDQIQISVSFTNTSGVAADPTTVTVTIREPDGTETTRATTDSPNLVNNPSVGSYNTDFTVAQPGRHYVRWTGTGNIIAALQQEFYAVGKPIA